MIKADIPNKHQILASDVFNPQTKACLNQIPVGIFLADLEGNIVFFNHELLKLIESNANDNIHESFFKKISSKDHQNFQDKWQLLVKQKLSFEMEIEFCLGNRSSNWLNVSTQIYKNENGENIGFTGRLLDITERIKTERNLRLSEHRLRTIIETEPECVKLVGAAGELLEMNAAGLAMLEVDTIEQAKASSLFSFILPEHHEAFKALHIKVMSGENAVLEFQVKGKKGTKLWLETHATRLLDENSNESKLLGITRNITDRKQAEAKTLEALALAQKAARAKSQFLDIASHELRTPITGLSLLLQMSQKNLKKGVAVSDETLARLRTQLDHISHLVTELLDVSRIERGVVSLILERKDLSSIIQSCLEEFNLRQTGRVIKFVPPSLPVKLKIDPFRIYQVISNLLNNAIKYTPENKPIEIEITMMSLFVRVTVKDQGNGIPENLVSDLFQAFKRGRSEAVSNTPGLGLGLFICREIMSLHGGKIDLVNEPGSGCTFFFDLPITN